MKRSVFANKEEQAKFQKKTSWWLWALWGIVLAIACWQFIVWLPQIKKEVRARMSSITSSAPQAQNSASATKNQKTPPNPAPKTVVSKSTSPPEEKKTDNQVEKQAQSSGEKEPLFPPDWKPDTGIPLVISPSSPNIPTAPAASSAVVAKKEVKEMPEVKKEAKETPEAKSGQQHTPKAVASLKKSSVLTTHKYEKDQFYAWMPKDKKKTETCLVDRPISIIPSQCSSVLVLTKRTNETYGAWMVRGLGNKS